VRPSADEPGAKRVEQASEQQVGATLLHKDHEFQTISDLAQECLG
jgi:hypothetical protein